MHLAYDYALPRAGSFQVVEVMRRWVSAYVVLAGALSVLAQAPVPSPEKNPEKKEDPASLCVVAGRVVTAAEGSPLKSARVYLNPENYRSEKQNYSATSDGDGRFLIKDVVPGRHQFFATRPGFVSQQYQSQGMGDGAVLGLKAGQKISDVLFRMTMSAVISGRVNNEDGEAMLGIQITALRMPNEEELEDDQQWGSRRPSAVPVGAARTDDRGQYRIFGLKPSEYYVRASDWAGWDPGIAMAEDFWAGRSEGSEYAPVYFPGVTQLGQAQMVSLRAGEEAQADFSMQRIKTVEVAGRLIGPGGPVKDAGVSLDLEGDYGIMGSRYQASSDEKGNFRIKGVPPGSYVLMAYQRSEDEDTLKAHARQKLEVGGENIESLTIALGGGVSFEGRVTVAGEGSVTLDRLSVGMVPVKEENEFGGHGRVKKDGTFQISSVTDGDYAVNVWGLEQEWYVKSVRLGAEDVREKGLQVGKGTSGGALEVVLSKASSDLEGSVSEGRQAIAGARVRLAPEPPTPYNRYRANSIRTDQNGRFTFRGLAPGKYRVYAKSQPVAGGDALKSEAQVVTLGEHEHKSVDLAIEKEATQ